jgi:2-polyprenyl-3-methyl-5-hydroxy-6-metoxy-1,4-benzoquinol methylase
MNYKDIYTSIFNIESYSTDYHIQYDYILYTLKQLNLNTNNIIDIGSGRGHLIKLLKVNNLSKLSIISVDLKKFHNYDVNEFIECDLSNYLDRTKLLDKTKLLNKANNIVICTDVLEHLDKSFIEDVVYTFSKMSNYCILGIANHSDIINGIELHTIQENDIWWEAIITKYFRILNKDTFYHGRLYIYVLQII